MRTIPALKILIVEDQFLIARQVGFIASEAGHRIVGIAGTLGEGCRLAKSEEPDLAFVDLSLADGLTGTDVGRYIVAECDATVVYITANRRRLPDDFAGALGVVEKPFTKGGLAAALTYIAAVMRNEPMPDRVPESLTLAPRRKNSGRLSELN